MSARDVIALEASERTAVTLLDSSARTGSGSGDAIQFENLSRVYVRAAAKNRTTRHRGAASLTVTVEDSADGSSWSTVATFTFTDTETQAEAVDSPQAYLRVSWSVSSGTWAFGADAVLFASGAADTGGSQPAATDGAGVDIAAVSEFRFPAGSLTDLGSGAAGVAVQTRVLNDGVVAFNAPGLATDAVLVYPLDPDTLVLRVWAIFDVGFDPGVQFNINVGGADFGAPDDDNGLLITYDANAGGPEGGNGYEMERSLVTTPSGVWASRIGHITGAGGGICVNTNMASAAGSARVFALIAVPT